MRGDEEILLEGEIARTVEIHHRMRAGRDLVHQIGDGPPLRPTLTASRRIAGSV
jgi:hypothetical protein